MAQAIQKITLSSAPLQQAGAEPAKSSARSRQVIDRRTNGGYRLLQSSAPQADALIEEFAARVILAPTAYNSDRARKTVATNGAKAISSNYHSRALNINSISRSTLNGN